ncbi:DNA-3-methyladenine glycosylase family protein [Halosegnis marinus]|uniref:DNA-3-methyladenine glycosylase family protein n=1 Tax=Halosegnis marinus TaxID=3034023 RepID=A0ABD5ZSW2_9EURY|nr:DNA-3-methyladenine glycosylase 2 family protein [Halosegnis sp. DT85]
MDPHDRLREDPELGPLVADHGELELERADDPFARLVVAVCNQQLSQASAAAIEERLFDRFDVTPAAMLAADDEALRDVGLSGQKVGYVRNIARAFDGDLSVAALDDMTDDEVRDALTGITGVGPWTADMFLLFVLAREDVFPVGDLGIRKGMAALYGFDVEDRAGMTEHAERWAPYRSYAARYLWRADD